MRWLFIMLSILQANAGWRTNGTVPAMVDVTPDVKLEDLSAYLHAFYTLSDGTPHVVLGFDGIYAQAWDVNLSNGVSTVFSMTNAPFVSAADAFGVVQMSCITTLSNTLLVCSSAQRSNQFWEFNPVTRTSQMIFTNSDKLVPSICRAPDGVIFMGTFGMVNIDAWNPSNRTFWSYGRADTNLAGIGNYGYYLSANNTHVYCAIRGGDPEWYLSITDRATTNKTLFFNQAGTTDVTIYDGLDGKVYAATTTNSIRRYWALTNGTPANIPSLPAVYDEYHEEPGMNRNMDNWDTTTGWQFEIEATAYSVQGSVPTTSMRWKRTNDVSWSFVTETNSWLPGPGVYTLLQPRLNTSELLWITRGSGPVGSFAPGVPASILGVYKAQSTRDVLQVSATEAYIAGYHLNTLRWNPSLAWTFNPSTADFTAPTNNPYRMDASGGIYHSMLVRGSDGRIFNASRWERGGVGGSLQWYNPTTGAIGTERNLFTNSWDTPTDLKGAVGNSKIVWSSWQSNIFVFDAATFTKDTNFTLMNNSTVQKMVEYQSGKLFGISGSNTLGFTTTGTLLYSNNLPAAPYDITSGTTDYERITLGPDNYVWQTAGGYLYRINPADGTYVQVRQTTNNYKITFSGGDAYLYGSSTIWKLPSLLQFSSEARISTLTKR